MAHSLKETVKALKGLVVMSPELEAVSSAMYDNQVRGPRRFLAVCMATSGFLRFV